MGHIGDMAYFVVTDAGSPISTAEVARRMGCTVTKAYTALVQLEKYRMVARAGLDFDGPGPRKLFWRLVR